jgi:hypothetical protein
MISMNMQNNTRVESASEADSLKKLGQSELRHNSKDGLFTVVKRL